MHREGSVMTKHGRTMFFFFFFMAGLLARAQAPYVGASEADNEFSRITAAEMKIIRANKALITSRSSGLNLVTGLTRLARKNMLYSTKIAQGVVNLFYDSPDKMPVGIFENNDIVQYLDAVNPPTRRFDDAGKYLRLAPWSFASVVKVCFVMTHGLTPKDFGEYCSRMDALRKEFPGIVFIYATPGLLPVPDAPNNTSAWEFGDLVLAKYKGIVPIIDWRNLLSTRPDGSFAGRMMVPEYNALPPGRPDKIHPNGEFIEERFGRAWLVMARKIFCSPGLTANAGFDRTVIDADGNQSERIILDGSASTAFIAQDSTGQGIISYTWSEHRKPIASSKLDTTEVDLPVGKHVITLTITDDRQPAETSSDDVIITISRK
jgi:hypothetical protein